MNLCIKKLYAIHRFPRCNESQLELGAIKFSAYIFLNQQ